MYTENTLKSAMGERLRAVRENMGLSMQKVADLVGVDKNRYAAWESGRNAVTLEWIPALCAVLGCDVGYLFGEYPEKTRTAADVCAVTGLSEQAVTTLHSFQINYPNYLRVLNFLLSECAHYFWHLLGCILRCSEDTLAYHVGGKRIVEADKLEKTAGRIEKREPGRAGELREQAASVRVSEKDMSILRMGMNDSRREAEGELNRIMDVCAKPENGLIPYSDE